MSGMNIQGSGAMSPKAKNIEAAPGSTWKSIKRLLGFMKKSRVLIVFTVVIAIAGTVIQVISPKVLGEATTIIFEGIKDNTGIDMGALITVLISVAIMYLIVFLCTFLQERLMTVVSLRTTESLRNAVKSKLNNVPISYFDKNSTGDMMSVAVNDIDNITQNLQQSLTELISSVILIVGILAIMLTISPVLTLIACVIVPATFLITKFITPFAQKHNKKYFAGMGKMNGGIEETYNNFVVVKSFEGEEKALESFRDTNEELRESGWKGKFIGQSSMHILMLVKNVVFILIAALGAIQVMAGGLLIGNLQAFLQYSQQFSSPISQLSMIWSNLLSVVASAERVFSILDADEMEDKKIEESTNEETAKVVFNDVKFGYDEEPLMKGFNLKVENGETIAIVGHTGAGKTTLVNLLERFYDIQGGIISIDGKDIRAMDYNKLRNRMGMVLQDTWLFSGTIFENIKYGRSDATVEDVYNAAKAAYADEFIEKLPDGYDTMLQEDAGNISQGQRQLITIARAFLSDPEILILDEATSNVDSRTEMILQKAMKQLMDGRTSFVIAHRLSTICDADRIIVMENGDIVETGTHLELIGKGGVYADIYNSQFKQVA